jgi:hypothetical protein
MSAMGGKQTLATKRDQHPDEGAEHDQACSKCDQPSNDAAIAVLNLVVDPLNPSEKEKVKSAAVHRQVLRRILMSAMGRKQTLAANVCFGWKVDISGSGGNDWEHDHNSHLHPRRPFGNGDTVLRPKIWDNRRRRSGRPQG